MKLDYCENCLQMTNHKNNKCLKCMKIPTLCDRCKREFDCEEDDLTTYDGREVAEIICQNCKDDSWEEV